MDKSDDTAELGNSKPAVVPEHGGYLGLFAAFLMCVGLCHGDWVRTELPLEAGTCSVGGSGEVTHCKSHGQGCEEISASKSPVADWVSGTRVEIRVFGFLAVIFQLCLVWYALSFESRGKLILPAALLTFLSLLWAFDLPDGTKQPLWYVYVAGLLLNLGALRRHSDASLVDSDSIMRRSYAQVNKDDSDHGDVQVDGVVSCDTDDSRPREGEAR